MKHLLLFVCLLVFVVDSCIFAKCFKIWFHNNSEMIIMLDNLNGQNKLSFCSAVNYFLKTK